MTTISIQCTHCLKRYNAPASMAGKRVKCKHCGEIFAIPADAADGAGPLPIDVPLTPLPRIAPLPKQGARKVAPPADADAGPEDESRPNPAIRAIGSGAGKLKAPSSDEDEPAAKIGDPRHGIAARVKRSADVQELDIAGDRPEAVVSVRPSVPWDFPGADVLDRLAPPVLAVCGLAWLGFMAAGAHPEGVAWPGLLKLGLYLALFFAVGLPMGYAAVAWAARRRRFAMARPALWRALGAFAFPFSLALVLWLVGGSGGMLIVGTILGAALACAAVWFLFRIQPQEVGTTLGATAVGFSLSIVVSYVLMLVVSLIMAATARSSGTNRLAESPVGPTFAWDVPVATDEPRGKGTPTAVDAPTTNEVPMVATGVGAAVANESTAGGIAGVEALASTGAGTDTAAMAAAAAREVAGAVAMAGQSSASEGVAARAVAVVPPPPPPTTTKPAPPVEVAIEPASPLVASVKSVDVGPFDSLLFPQSGGPVVATVRAVGDSDQIELWALNPPQRKGQATIRREKTINGGYALTPSGEMLAHVVTWPSLKAKMWSFAAGQDVGTKDVELAVANGTPAVLGFGAGDSLVIHWTAGEGKVGFEVFGTREPAGRLIADAVVVPYEPGSGNPSIQPGGRLIAFAAFAENVAGIDLYDLTSRRKKALSTLKVPLSKWVKPTGMAFAPSGAQIAAFFEHEGRGLITIHTVAPPGKLVHEHQYAETPVPILAGQGVGPGSRTLDWVDHQTLLLYGTVLVDAESGQPLGSLGIDRVRTQAVIDRETVLVHAKGKDGEADRVLLVKLKGDEVEKARKAVRAGRGK